MTTGSQKHDKFLKAISAFVDGKRIYTDTLRCLAWGTDAGFYRLVPKIVVRAKDEEEVSGILSVASRFEVPVTFRAAGTSLSGQAITDSVLVVAGKNWEKYSLAEDKKTITLEPGIIGSRVNEILAPHGLMFAPDPASKNSAMVGGIIINNASGMNCGTHANSDKILHSMRIILVDGTILDTGDEMSRNEFRQSHPKVLAAIEQIRDEINADADLVKRIKYKYSIKNVTGLNLLPFVLYSDPFDIIAHCMVGSEGTLAFMSSATVATSHLYQYSASAMLYFKDMSEACRCVVALKKGAPVFSCEMLDRKSLEAVNDTTGEGLTALLLDTKADTQDELDANIAAINKVIDEFTLFQPAHFSTDPAETGKWWGIRSGVFPAVGGTRPLGTTSLIEDVAFHINDLPEATADLVTLLKDCGYEDSCIYGHALEGNYHFVIAQSFDSQDDIDKYRRLMEEIVKLVVDKYDGSLKAEHGVGRNMAPFIAREWGEKAYDIMRRIKMIFDPQNILNKGSMFNDDPECYVKNMKSLIPVHEIVDKCIECGFCEVNCVSHGLTLSARQRIVILRELKRLSSTGNPEDEARAKELYKAFHIPGNATCAGDGLCATSCPMKIKTGKVVHVLRERDMSALGYKTGRFAADNLSGLSKALRLTLNVADMAHRVIGDSGVRSVGKAIHYIGVPLWTPSLPPAFSPKKAVRSNNGAAESDKVVVYFPSCLNRTLGAGREKDEKVAPLVETMVKLCNKAGYRVIFPENMEKLCCGMIWDSKGMPDIAKEMITKLEIALAKASENGKYPILCDQSPCLHRMKENITSLKLYEPAEFISEYLADNLIFERDDEPIAVHVTCSTRRMGLADTIINLARRCSSNVTVPAEVGCCGFAGDKGFTHPELNQWGLRKLRPALERAGVKHGYSNSRTCEIGLTTNSGISYKSIVYLVDAHTRPKTQSRI